MTTLEAAEQFGMFTKQGDKNFLEEHGLSFRDAYRELGDKVFDAYELCLWIGY